MKFSHIGFVVNDLDAELSKWKQHGYHVIKEPVHDKTQNIRCCLISKPNELIIELVSPSSSGQHPLNSRLRRGGGLDHICYEVDNLENIIQMELLLGSKMVLKKTYAILLDGYVVFFYRKSGLVVEYLEKGVS
jgi:methylmalonyl-CoA/ethylmalonyl-CoA epimerase